MISIAVINSKGGVGKTTLAASLAVWAAQESRRVALVDLDPQASLLGWWRERGEKKKQNLTIFEGEPDACDAIEALSLTGYDWAFLDSPPALLQTIADCIACADLVVIPLRPSMLDMIASQDAFVLARDAGKPMLLVLNDCHASETLADAAQKLLERDGVPLAKTKIMHRVAHTRAMGTGKTAAEVPGGSVAAHEIENLWKEVKRLARKAHSNRAKAGSK